jgi:hypothetical protein
MGAAQRPQHPRPMVEEQQTAAHEPGTAVSIAVASCGGEDEREGNVLIVYVQWADPRLTTVKVRAWHVRCTRRAHTNNRKNQHYVFGSIGDLRNMRFWCLFSPNHCDMKPALEILSSKPTVRNILVLRTDLWFALRTVTLPEPYNPEPGPHTTTL